MPKSKLALLAALICLASGTASVPASGADQVAVTAELVDRNGEPPARGNGELSLLNRTTGRWFDVPAGRTVRVPPGDYAGFGYVLTPRPGEPDPSLGIVSRPRLSIESDRTVRFDARTADRLRVEVDRRDARFTDLTYGVLVDGGLTYGLDVSETWNQVYVGGQQRPVDGVVPYVRTRIGRTDATLEVRKPERFGVEVWQVPESPPEDADLRAELVDGGRGRPADLAGLDLRGRAVLTTPRGADSVAASARAIERAGGVAMVVRLRTSLSAPTTELAVPSIYTTRGKADRIVELADQGEVTVRLSTVRNSPYVYDLALPLAGQPTNPIRVRDRELARVDTEWSRALPDMRGGYSYPEPEVDGTLLPLAGFCCQRVALPGARTEYYTPGEWRDELNLSSSGLGNIHYTLPERELAAGDRDTERYGAPVFGPALGARPDSIGWNGGRHWVSREGEQVRVAVPLLADGDGHVNWQFDQSADMQATGDTELFRDGELVGRTERPGVGRFDTPAGPARFRLSTRFERDTGWWPLSTTITADWRVRSKGDGVLPLLAVRYQPEVDAYGRAPGGRPYRLPISVQREPGAPASPVTGLRLEVSYDDGASWRPAPVRPNGDGWVARLRHPDRGYVSLRAHAEDAAGNTVDQTILRAYQLD